MSSAQSAQYAGRFRYIIPSTHHCSNKLSVFSFQLPRQITPSPELTLINLKLIPQIIINYRRHNTVGLQRSMMLLWACAGVPLGAYNISENFNIALQIQPQILTVLSLITWIQCYHYDDVSSGPRSEAGKPRSRPYRDWIIVINADMDQKWSPLKCCVVVGLIGAIFGGVETGLVFALKVGYFHISLTVS
jgi:PQ loop repeat